MENLPMTQHANKLSEDMIRFIRSAASFGLREEVLFAIPPER